jgi:capsular exopolysaccharide synthesis family protein
MAALDSPSGASESRPEPALARSLPPALGAGASQRGLVPLSPGAITEEPEPGGDFSIRHYWRVLRGRRRTVLCAAAASVLAAAIVNYVQAPTYRATATLRIDREEPSIAQLDDADSRSPEPPDYIETHYRVLRSRSLARRVIDKLQLAGRVEFNAEIAGRRGGAPAKNDLPPPRAETLPPAVVDAFLEKLSVDPGKGTRLVSISFESVDPLLAPLVVNTLGEQYIEHNLETKWQATRKASAWLQQQLSSLRTALESSESGLRRYAAEHSILFVEERKDVATEKLAQLEQELTQAEADRIQKQSLAISIEELAGSQEPLPGHLDSRTYQDLQAGLAALEQKRSEMQVAFGARYPAMRRVENEIEQLEKSVAAERSRLVEGVREGRRLAERRERLLREAVERQRRVVQGLGENFIHYNILKRDSESNRTLYEGLLRRLKEAGVAASLRASNIALLDAAEVPQDVYRPRKTLNLLIALAGGLLAGAVLAFLQEHFDAAVRTPEEVERLTGLCLLAIVPRVRMPLRARRIPLGSVLALDHAGSPRFLLGQTCREGEAVKLAASLPADLRATLTEAYRSLRSALLLDVTAPPRRILVTSSQAEEGKTTVSLNLASSLAQLGGRVLLVDADMRRPNCAVQLRVRARQGLSDYLEGRAEISEVISETPVPGLSVIAGGSSPEAAADLVHSPRLASLLEAVSARYDHVILDSPPSLVLSDARTISRLVDGVILVISGATDKGALLRTKRTFDQTGVRLLGFVMNRADLGHADYGYYRTHGYNGGYSGETAA